MHNKAGGLLLCAFLLVGLAAYGADPTGTIAGAVLDPSGAAVPGAKITAIASATGLTRTTIAPPTARIFSRCCP